MGKMNLMTTFLRRPLPIIFAAVSGLALTAGLAGFYVLAQELATQILKLTLTVSGEQLRLVGYLLIAQGVIITAAGLISVLLPSASWRLGTLFTAGILGGVLGATTLLKAQVPIYLLGVIPVALAVFSRQTNKAKDLFKKFSLRRVVFYHTRILYLTFSLYLAIAVYIFSGQNPKLIEQSINQYTSQVVKSLVSQQVSSLENRLGEREALVGNLPLELNQLVPEDWFKDWLKSYQLSENLSIQEQMQQELQQAVVAQTQDLIGPYVKYLPYLLTVVAFLTFYQVAALMNFFYLIVAWAIFKLLLLAKIAELKPELQPVEVLRLRGLGETKDGG